MAFSATLETSGNIATIALSGELDANSAGEFRARVEEAAANSPEKLVLMMEDLTFMASAGLRVLIFAKQKMGSDVDLFVVAPQEPVRETMEMTGFHHSVIMLDEYDAAEIEG
jgi:anti-anti-sigma factor